MKIINSKKYPKWALKKAKENNITYPQFHNRVSNRNWSLERACTEPIHSNMSKKRAWTDEEVAYLEKAYETDCLKIEEIAKELNRSISSVTNKICYEGFMKGWG